MKIINTGQIIQNIKEMCIDVNYQLSADMDNTIRSLPEKEKSPLGQKILNQLVDNLDTAKSEYIPICQDTGMVVVFVKLGQDVRIQGCLIEDAIEEGVRQGYHQGYLRKSVVGDPILRVNTKDNTPAVIHYEIVSGDTLELTVAPKGFGSENMSRSYMLKPADGIEGIKKSVLDTVSLAGPNACPPIVVGVGIGGNFEKSALLSKKALLRNADQRSNLTHIRQLEEELLCEINKLGIGPGGLGGKITAICVNIEVFATHIAGLPVSVNICCHVNRHITRVLQGV